MTAADKVRFVQSFNRLAVASRLPAAEADAAMQRIYFEGLEDLPIDAVEAAAGELVRTSEWFPKVSEWRTAAKTQRTVLLTLALPPAREEPWREECEACHDTGWELKYCYPGTPVICERRGPSPKRDCSRDDVPEHTYVVPCVCRATNRTFQRTHRYVSHEEQPA